MPYAPPRIPNAAPSTLSGTSQTQIETVLRPLAAASGQLPVQAVVRSWGGQVGQTRRAHIEVRSALQRNASGVFLAVVWVSSTPGGSPDGTQVLTVVDGTLVREMEAGRVLLVASDVAGKISIDVEGGAGDRWIGVSPIGGVWGGLATWA